MTLHAKYIAGNLAYWDTHRQRLVDAIGADVVKFTDDFVHSPLAAADAPVGWTVTLVEAGAGESTITKPDGIGGTLLITTDANEDDGIEMQLVGESFELTAEQSAVYFGIRFQASEATQNDILAGLCITDSTLLGGMSDGVYFEKLDGGTGTSFTVEKNATETQADALAVFAAATWTIWEFYWDGAILKAYINGVLVATPVLTNLPDDEFLTPSIQVLAGSAAINTLTIDWIRAIQIGR